MRAREQERAERASERKVNRESTNENKSCSQTDENEMSQLKTDGGGGVRGQTDTAQTDKHGQKPTVRDETLTKTIIILLRLKRERYPKHTAIEKEREKESDTKIARDRVVWRSAKTQTTTQTDLTGN